MAWTAAGLVAAAMGDLRGDAKETIKIKLIDDQFKAEVPRFNGFFHGVSTIVKEEGAAASAPASLPTILKVATARARGSACST